MRASLLQAIARKPQVMLKITRYSRSAQGVRAHLSYISRTGKYGKDGDQVPVYDQDGAILTDPDQMHAAGEQLADGIPGMPRRGRGRVAMQMMLSMPPGTDPARFRAGVQEFLSAQFRAHEYLYAFHDDTDHYHAHILIGMQGLDGRWLRPGPADLQDWREAFAEALERNGIEATASRAYARGQRPRNYRRDLAELDARDQRDGTQRRRRPAVSPSYRPEAEDQAIAARAAAWRRLAVHYAEQGDQEAAGAIRGHLREQFGVSPALADLPAQERREARERLRPPVPAPTRRPAAAELRDALAARDPAAVIEALRPLPLHQARALAAEVGLSVPAAVTIKADLYRAVQAQVTAPSAGPEPAPKPEPKPAPGPAPGTGSRRGRGEDRER